MNGIVIELELSPQQYEQLAAVAQTRQLAVMEATRMAVSEWLEREARLERARSVMRAIGRGLGEGNPPHNAAGNHDVLLYGRTAR